ncbi:hypothetical protein [Oceanisphaera sp. KMM 10153]|uniref:hypothetical protein n=1 Tax=Oceanisphaera submarina TaxID=3390193 RepID=UPI003974AE1A
MRRQWGTPEEQIKKLEQELWSARYAILGLAPAAYQEILRSYYRCNDRSESYHWLDSVAEKIIETVEPLPNDKGSFFGARAYCPLCGEGTSSTYERGYALPEGLRRHLTGWGRSQMCAVTEAAHQLALDHFHDEFSAEEETQRLEQQKRKNARLRNEVLLRTGPLSELELMDETGYFGEPRNKSDWVKAESRLDELGFEMSEDERVRQYVLDAEAYGVYADPRSNKEIVFRVYRKPFPKRVSRTGVRRYSQFVIRDSWKNDISGKFHVRLEKALTEL